MALESSADKLRKRRDIGDSMTPLQRVASRGAPRG